MRLGIIGGGAAGFFAAISAASHNSSAEVVILESTHQPLSKVRISGGGRCNVTHNCFSPQELVKYYPRGHKELLGPFSRFQPRDAVAWFMEQGVRLKVEDDGRIFPETDKSSTIIDCLQKAALDRKIIVRSGTGVETVKVVGSAEGSAEFEIELKDGGKEQFDRILLATGSGAYGYVMAEALGHKIIPCVPSLFTFEINDPRLDGLAGISFDIVRLTLRFTDRKKLEQTGPMLITHWGLSGPAVLKLSAWGARLLYENNYRADLKINFLPKYKRDDVRRLILDFKMNNGRSLIRNELPFKIPKRYWSRIVQVAGLPDEITWSNLPKNSMEVIIDELIQGQYSISGKGEFKEEFVTCGGVDLKEVDFRTMESKLCPGLYFAGEILDIDGLTGGFNFQSAWTTGWIAGLSMSELHPDGCIS